MQNLYGIGRSKCRVCLLLSALLLFLAGCTPPPPVFPQGQQILKGGHPVPPEGPDSLGAELSFTFHEGRGRNTVSATFSAVPYDRYKLDFLGLFGMLLASFYFEDSLWTLAIYEEGVYFQEKGDRLALPRLGVEPISVHLFFSFLWGHFLPVGTWEEPVEYALSEAEGRVVEVIYEGELWRIQLDGKTGLVKAYVQEERQVRLEFDRYDKIRGRPLPRRAMFFREGKKVLTIEVKALRDEPQWRRSPFSIRVPPSFRRVSPDEHPEASTGKPQGAGGAQAPGAGAAGAEANPDSPGLPGTPPSEEGDGAHAP